MTDTPLLHSLLPRAVLSVGGPDRESFLQGLVSNDVRRAAADRAIFAALLSAQGRFLHDFHITAAEIDGPALLLDPEAERAADLLRRLKLYRLRAKVELADVSQRFAVHALLGRGAAEAAGLPAEAGAARPYAGGVIAVDARDGRLGVRAILPRDDAAAALAALGAAPAPFEAWDRHRLSLGIPDGSRDLPVDKALLMESGYDTLHAIDWRKGCYIGQELTARTKYRGLVKRALVPVAVEGPMPDSGAPVEAGGTVVGEMRSGRDGLALALLRLGTEGPMSVGGTPVTRRATGT